MKHDIERVLIWSVDPRVSTAYGQQCGLLALQLRALGYDVAIGAIGAKVKHQGKPWNGIPVRFVGGRGDHGGWALGAAVHQHKADLVLCLFDSFMLNARTVAQVMDEYPVKIGYWCPVDAFNINRGGLPPLYSGMLQIASRAVPLAMSRWAEAMFRHDGHRPLYVPHMIDTGIFCPVADRAAHRVAHGIDPAAFVITMCAANSERLRKNFPGQFDAFRRAAGPDWLLLVHTYCRPDQDGWDLEDLAIRFGIADRVIFADPDRYKKGGYTQQDLAAWYNLGDLHTQCTLAEGFGIPLLEAQACGLPVVATDGSAMSELVGAGWKIPGEPIMNPGQRAEWILPIRALIADAYQAADRSYLQAMPVAGDPREFALDFSVPAVMDRYWKPALEELADR